MININRLYQSIGPERCLALPMFHAMSSCDTTSGPKSNGKRLCIWWNTWNKHPEVTETFVKISQHHFQVLSGDDFASVKDFVCQLYDNISTTSEVNVLRMNMFCQRSQDVQRIPPTQDALIISQCSQKRLKLFRVARIQQPNAQMDLAWHGNWSVQTTSKMWLP